MDDHTGSIGKNDSNDFSHSFYLVLVKGRNLVDYEIILTLRGAPVNSIILGGGGGGWGRGRSPPFW